MIDWTSDEAGDFWRDLKRQPLIANGVIGHWIDLGEPEMYDATRAEAIRPTGWLGSSPASTPMQIITTSLAISNGRKASRAAISATGRQRPFIMARSGAAGIQRYGVICGPPTLAPISATSQLT